MPVCNLINDILENTFVSQIRVLLKFKFPDNIFFGIIYESLEIYTYQLKLRDKSVVFCASQI